MNLKRRDFQPGDYEKIRNFLQETYSQASNNWTIERWAWSRYSVCYWLDCVDKWLGTIGIWVDETDRICAVVSNEGNYNGSAYFQLRQLAYEDQQIHEMVDYAEKNLYAMKDKQKVLSPRLNKFGRTSFEKVFRQRGYLKSMELETDATIFMEEDQPVVLAEGFTLDLASSFTAEERAQAHGRAFTDTDDETPSLMEERTRSFDGLIQAPDYESSLDLCLVDEQGQIASFATFWFDSKNSIGSLEPLGTILRYRRLGLAKALVYEGMNRLRKLGAKKLHVGSNQDFYKDIGFSVESQTEVWTKTFT